jgi:hypothetical protein
LVASPTTRIDTSLSPSITGPSTTFSDCSQSIHQRESVGCLLLSFNEFNRIEKSKRKRKEEKEEKEKKKKKRRRKKRFCGYSERHQAKENE